MIMDITEEDTRIMYCPGCKEEANYVYGENYCCECGSEMEEAE